MNDNTKKKRIIRRLAVALLLLLLICTFVSRSVYTTALTRVSVAPVASGILIFETVVEASVEFPDAETVRASGTWKIEEVLCKTDKRVYADTPILRLNTDAYSLQMEQLEYQLWTLDRQISQTGRTEDLRRQRELLTHQIDILKKSMPEDGLILALEGGHILSVLVSEGEMVSDGQPLFVFVPAGSLPTAVWTMDREEAKHYPLGTKCTFSLEGGTRASDEKLTATAGTKSWDETTGLFRYSIELPLPDAALFSQVISVELATRTGSYKTLVPVSSLQDNGDFIYLLKERDGLFGPEQYVQKVEVTVANQNDRLAFIRADGLYKDDLVITAASGHLFEGDTVWRVEEYEVEA